MSIKRVLNEEDAISTNITHLVGCHNITYVDVYVESSHIVPACRHPFHLFH